MRCEISGWWNGCLLWWLLNPAMTRLPCTSFMVSMTLLSFFCARHRQRWEKTMIKLVQIAAFWETILKHFGTTSSQSPAGCSKNAPDCPATLNPCRMFLFESPLSFEVKTHDFKDNQDVYLLSSFFAGIVDLMILEEVSEVLTYIICTIIDMGPDWPPPSETFDARDWCGRQWHGELYWVIASTWGDQGWEFARFIEVWCLTSCEMYKCECFFFRQKEIAVFFFLRFIAANISKKQYLQEQVCFLLSCFHLATANGSEESWVGLASEVKPPFTSLTWMVRYLCNHQSLGNASLIGKPWCLRWWFYL